MKHTKEPWRAEERRYRDLYGEIATLFDEEYAEKDYLVLADGSRGSTEEDARRIVACVNACQGIANPDAVGDVVEALEVLANVVDTISYAEYTYLGDAPEEDLSWAWNKAQIALAKLEATNGP